MSNIEKINEYFHLPISFDKKSIELNPTIITDLELNETIDPSGTPLYHYAFQPKTILGKRITTELSKFYTTNKKYLKETQFLLKKYKKNNENQVSYDVIIRIWDDVKNDTNFKEKYHFIDWSYATLYAETLNNSQEFLQILSMYNLASPLISVLMPIFILIIPFFIITIKGYELSFSKYLTILKDYAKSNAIGQLFTHYKSVSNDKKIYLIASTFIYILSIYQNFMSCIRFHKNMIKIHDYFNKISHYIEHTNNNVNNFLSYSNSLKTYQDFNTKSIQHLSVLLDLNNDIKKIYPYTFSLQKVYQLGKIMKLFYSLYKDVNINNAFMWSFGMNGYIDCLDGLTTHINNNKIKLCKVGDKKNKKNNIFKNAYYLPLINDNPVKNNINIEKNLIITGPNASGKTTILKTSLINIIFSQQFGCGFYSNAYIVPYKYIHCYLNIPDTSGRDSLFQAEARRCKNIIDMIHDNNTETHFCVFDELYSGTNPEEAVNSAKGFMKYLIKFKGVHCMLTTHFYDICKDLDNNPHFENCHMVTENDDLDKDIFKYTYKLEKGISNVHGGMKVLRDMNYPKEIIESQP